MKKVLMALTLLLLFSLGNAIVAQAPAPNPFKARPEPEAEVTYHNPVIPGFYSDPSVVRVGEAERSTFRFSYSQGDEGYQEIQEVSARYLSSETIGGFTGTFVGLYATGNGQPSSADADYDWFEYQENGPP